MSTPDSDEEEPREAALRESSAPWINPQPKARYELIVLGGGPAGVAAAEAAARGGLAVALVERERLGGNSLNAGSIPSKAIIRSANLIDDARHTVPHGAATLGKQSADLGKVMARMRRIRARIAEYHSAARLSRQGIDVFFASAHFTGRRTLLAGATPLKFRKALIATGAAPARADIPGLESVRYLTSDSIFDLTTLPRRLAVIGGGPLGCEIAQAFCRLGSQVTILQDDAKFLPHEERDAAECLSLSMSRDGVETRLNTTVVGVAQRGAEKLVECTNYGSNAQLIVDEVLVSTGRVPNVTGLGLASAGIEFDPERGIHVNEFLRTSNPAIYAAGDVCMEEKFTNVAEATGRMAVRNAFGTRRRRSSQLLVPWCTYCDPEIAHIGMSVLHARRHNIPVQSFTIMMHDVDRAITDGQDEGFFKIHVREGTDRILGATIVAARASEMINEVSVLMSAGVGLRRLADILHAYPSQSDAIRLAAAAFVRDGEN